MWVCDAALSPGPGSGGQLERWRLVGDERTGPHDQRGWECPLLHSKSTSKGKEGRKDQHRANDPFANRQSIHSPFDKCQCARPASFSELRADHRLIRRRLAEDLRKAGTGTGQS